MKVARGVMPQNVNRVRVGVPCLTMRLSLREACVRHLKGDSAAALMRYFPDSRLPFIAQYTWLFAFLQTSHDNHLTLMLHVFGVQSIRAFV